MVHVRFVLYSFDVLTQPHNRPHKTIDIITIVALPAPVKLATKAFASQQKTAHKSDPFHQFSAFPSAT